MAEPGAPISFPALVTSWHRAGLLDRPAIEAIGAHVMERQRHEDPPIYARILAAIGTVLSTIFLLLFLGISGLIDFSSEAGLVIWGGIFLAGGIATALAGRRMAVGIGRDLVEQSSLAGLAVGKVLFVMGVVSYAGFDARWAVTIALLAVSILTYPVSGSSLDRLLSPYAVLCSVLFEVLERDALGANHTLLLTGLFVAFAALAGGLLLSGNVTRLWRPLGLAGLAGMGTVICILASGHDFGFWAGRDPISPWPIVAVSTVLLIGLVVWAAGGVRQLASEPLILTLVGIAALGLAGAPGVLFALGLLILGHAHHDRPIKVIGILALPVFLSLWYYGRDMTLMEKSVVLVGSGVVLLAARFYLAWRGLDREPVA